MMNVASMAAVALWLAIALGAPHPSDAGEGSPRKGCVSAKFTPPNEQSPYGDARVVNECGHNDVAVWVGANWTVFSKKGAGHFEALDEDDLTHAVVRMPSQYPSGSPFVISRPVVGEDFAFKVCAHHVPGIDYALVAKWNNIRAEVLPPMYDDPRTDPRFKSGFEMLVRRGIPIESVKYLKRRIVDTYPFYGWYGERGLDSYFEVGTTALGKRLLKFYRENRGVCHPENLLNASQDPVTARVGGSQRQRESSITAADSGTFGPQARDAIQAWQSKNGISDAGNFVNTLALMVQTALVLQNFDPGPADGLFGKKTLAAILAWQAAMGYAQTGDLAGVLAAVLRTALVLQGFDPGPLDGMFRCAGTRRHPGMATRSHTSTGCRSSCIRSEARPLGRDLLLTAQRRWLGFRHGLGHCDSLESDSKGPGRMPEERRRRLQGSSLVRQRLRRAGRQRRGERFRYRLGEDGIRSGQRGAVEVPGIQQKLPRRNAGMYGGRRGRLRVTALARLSRHGAVGPQRGGSMRAGSRVRGRRPDTGVG